MKSPAEGAGTRAAAALAIDGVLTAGQTLERALEQAEPLLSSGRDRAQAQALAFGSLRWHCRHRAIIDRLLNRPVRPADRILNAILSVGLYELILGRAPGYAAVSAAVDATRLLDRPRAAGLVNATLRRFQREQHKLLDLVQKNPEARYGHPQWLIDRLQQDWPELWKSVLQAGQQAPPMVLRVNRHLGSREQSADALRDAGHPARLSAGYPNALYLEHPVPVDELPGFASGRLSVQDAAAQLAAALLAPAPGSRVLDACAAPGGKTVHLLELTGGDLEMLALDIDDQRLKRVQQNLDRPGYSARLLVGDVLEPAAWWDDEPFDSILLDAPCSATGVIRRHPDIRFLRREQDIAALAERQRAMLDTLWPMLKPGGRLLYATCSVLRAENHAVVDTFLAAYPDANLVEVPDSVVADAVPGDGPGWQWLPGAADTDGFYYALIEKRPAR